MFEKLFHLKENNTNVKTECIAGVTTFMTMAYILAVNPSILSSTGMNPTAVLLATCLASFLGTMCMGMMANLPSPVGRHGTERLFCLYRLRQHGLSMAGRTACRVCRGSDLHCPFADKCP